jgi:osmoprotectant transport system permease protein
VIRWKWICATLILVVSSIPFGRQRASVVVGSKKFTESVILGEMVRLLSIAGGTEAVHFRELGGTTLVFESLIGGDLDAYPEYTGTIDQEILRSKVPLSIENRRRALAARGVMISRSLGFDNSYGLGMRRERAAELGIAKISDLNRHPNLVYGLSNEFLQRRDGWQGLCERYDLAVEDFTGMDQDLAYRQLGAGAVDLIDIYTTDAKIRQLDLVVLEDDQAYFPRYEAVLLYRQDMVDRMPDVVRSWLQLQGKISPSAMIACNARVEAGDQGESVVAADWLSDNLEVTSQVVAPDRGERIFQRATEHVDLVRRSLLPAILLAIPLGIWAAKFKRSGRWILATVSVFQTIPSLALLVMLIPVMAALGFRSVGLGSSAAIIALLMYSLLPIVRNTHAGLTNIQGHYLESAIGLGLTARDRLFDIELPLARSSILAGIKTAAVMNVGFATLGALIGAGGFGQPILSGIRLNDTAMILEGAVPAAILALAVQSAFDLFERWTTPRAMRAR